MISPFYPRDRYDGGEGENLTESGQEPTKQSIEGRSVEHLAAKGWEIPNTLNHDLPCDEWDQRLRPMLDQVPASEILTWDLFKWIMGGVLTWMGVLSGMIYRATTIRNALEAHYKDDTARFERLEKRMEIEHAENIAAGERTRADLLKGQQNLATDFAQTRQFLQDFVLKQLDRDK